MTAVGGNLSDVTVLADGDVGLRGLQREAAPAGEHLLDWFHIAMRFHVMRQTAKGVSDALPEERSWMVSLLDRAKWHPWHGHSLRTAELLDELDGGFRGHDATFGRNCKLRRGLAELRWYLHRNRYSLANYAIRRRYGLEISTATTEATGPRAGMRNTLARPANC